jgi:hypothetical protein
LGVMSAMVFLALSRAGLNRALESLQEGCIVWCGPNLISEGEFNLRSVQNLTRCTYEVSSIDPKSIERILGSIEEHHPGEIVWVESVIES